jgi:hypothetical protein
MQPGDERAGAGSHDRSLCDGPRECQSDGSRECQREAAGPGDCPWRLPLALCPNYTFSGMLARGLRLMDVNLLLPW